jgi:hypothetical protein
MYVYQVKQSKRAKWNSRQDCDIFTTSLFIIYFDIQIYRQDDNENQYKVGTDIPILSKDFIKLVCNCTNESSALFK